jgi:outer membrane protein OmpA-like peptidoglycan-associated protein/tetratricopeptide (TPR) repeat protein
MLRILLLFLLLNFSFVITKAQWYDPLKISKQAGDLYAHADLAEQDENDSEAIADLNKAINIDPKFVDAYIARAGIYAAIKNYTAAVNDYTKSIALDSVYARPMQLSYSITLAGVGRFTDALAAVNSYLTLPRLNEGSVRAGSYRKQTYEFAIQYANEHPATDYVFAPKNLGDSINSKYAEYYPSITIDGKKMIFTRRIKDEDFYESDLIDNKWSKAKLLNGKVNTNLNEGAQSISVDGNWIVFTGCNYPEGQGSCDIYISYKTDNGWSLAENLGAAINTHFWESSPCLSPDKKDLYFSSDRPDGYGGKDIWVSHRNNNGTWSDAENMGPQINTPGDETCPFMYADNETLFFSTNGRPGYGQNDLFITKRLTDTTWSEPKNLGYPINTIDDEQALIVAADGVTAYYSSDRGDTKGLVDIYSFKLRKDIQPPRTLWVKGQVTDAKTQLGLPSSVKLTDINTRRTISDVQTDENGNYLATLPVGKDYDFSVNRKGYLFYSENYNLSEDTKDSVFTANIPLQPIEAGASIVLKNMFFDTKQTTLKPESIVELNRVIELMNDNPNLKILISGYTDNVGTAADNLALSNGRALAVVKYLLSSRQIMNSRLQSKGFGAAKPIGANTTEAGRAMNRRTELSVISN